MIDTTPYTVQFADLEAPISWSSIFGNDNPVEVEIGSGKGLFLANASKARPDHNFFGIELAKKYAGKGAERIAKKGLKNARMLPGDALLFMSKFVPEKSLVAVHVYFPDPWWKSRHRKRRVFNEPLVLDIERTLIPGGDLHVATDVPEYFGVIQGLLRLHPGFQIQPEPVIRDPEHEHDYLTNFERKYRIEGRPIYRAHYLYLPSS